MLTKREFDLLDAYFEQKNRYYRFLIQLLYYTGIRISEALAVTYADFEAFGDRARPTSCPAAPAPGQAGNGQGINGEAGEAQAADGSAQKREAQAADGNAQEREEAPAENLRLRITKSYISRMKLEKDTKNHKSRTIPLSPAPAALYLRLRCEHLGAGGRPEEKIFSVTYQAVNAALKRACERTGLPPASCHDFRHTFISNLMRKNVPISVVEQVTGDTQEMLLRRYSHAFANDEILVLNALREL